MRKSTSRPAEVWNFQMIIITLLFGYFPGGILRPSFPQWGTCSLPEIHTGPKGTPSSSSGSKSAAFTKTAKTQRQYLSWTVVWYEHTVSTPILMDDQPLATYIYITDPRISKMHHSFSPEWHHEAAFSSCFMPLSCPIPHSATSMAGCICPLSTCRAMSATGIPLVPILRIASASARNDLCKWWMFWFSTCRIVHRKIVHNNR